MPEEFGQICYTQRFGAVPKWPKGEVCKTSIRGFESHPRLQASRFKSMDYNFQFFPRIPNLGTFGNNCERGLFQPLDCAPGCLESHARTSSAWSQWSRVPIAAA